MEFRLWCCSVAFLCSVVFFSSASVSRADEESSEKEYVLTLDRSNFSEIVSKHDFIVVEFYAPWCGHCKKLAPEYEKAASILSKHDPPLLLAKVDANDELNKELASQYEISGYPSLKILRDGGKSIQEYKGPREANGIVSYVEKQAGPASIEIKSPEDVPKIKDDNKIFIAGVFPELSGEEFENFTKLAKRLRSDYDLGHTLDAKLLPFGKSSVRGPLLRLLKPFDELFVDFQDFDVDVLEKLVEKSSIPTVTVFNKDPTNHPYVIKFFNSPEAKALLFVNFSTEHFDKFKSNYHDTAALYKGKGVSFLLGDAESAAGALQYFGLKEDQVPLIVVQKDEHKKYLQANLDPDLILSWMNDYMEGRLPEFVKSEPIPEKNDEPVKVVVSHTLEQMVLNSGKNVLLEIYAPWCGHCKKLTPILEEVAVALEGERDVVIAKFDGTANDYPRDRFEVKGYPTLYFVSASGKMVQYEGERTKEAMIVFIQKNREKAVEQDSLKDRQTHSDFAKGDALDSAKDEL